MDRCQYLPTIIYAICPDSGRTFVTRCKRKGGQQKEASQLSEAHTPPVQVIIADDHEVVRIGLRALIARMPGITVIGEAESGKEAMQLVEELTGFDRSSIVVEGQNGEHRDKDHPLVIVVMDVRMPDGSGIDACRVIRERYPALKVIMLTSYVDDEAMFASFSAGASGYILKHIGGEELIRAIKTVAEGGAYLDPQTTNRLLRYLRKEDQALVELAAGGEAELATNHSAGTAASKDGAPELPEPLSEQERRILSLIAEGKTNREIAEDIFLSEKTVRNYVSNILGKLNLHNRAEAAAFAVRFGIASPPELAG